MTKDTAEQLAALLQGANESLGKAVQLIKEECTLDEFEIWRARLANVVGTLVLDALDPLYRERPALAPESLRDQYPLEPKT